MARRPSRARAKRPPRRKANGPTRPTKLRADLTAWLSGSVEKARLRFISISLEGLSGVVEKSPVDTGFFRASWGISINEDPPPATIPRPEGGTGGIGTGEVVASMTARLAGVAIGDVVWIYNPVVYGPRLEHGHSRQAPLGMVAVTHQELAAKYGRRR